MTDAFAQSAQRSAKLEHELPLRGRVSLARLSIECGLDERRELIEGRHEYSRSRIGDHAAPRARWNRERREFDRSCEHWIGPRRTIETESASSASPSAITVPAHVSSTPVAAVPA